VFVDFGIENLSYLIFKIAFDFDWRGWRLSTVQDGTRCVQLGYGDVEYRMYGLEFFG